LKEDLHWEPKVLVFRLMTKKTHNTSIDAIVRQLGKDKKFVKLLRQVQTEFDEGCNTINATTKPN
jgi:hypothetical protein